VASVVVVGAGLAGLAAAARLAKARHQVTVLESRSRLGGAWAATELDGITVDAAPPIFAFPAPWRDLFRKSGRALEAEFARSGAELVPAGPARHVFPDGSSLVLPIGRGDQHAAISERYGQPAADRWRDLVDGMADVWQALRPLGIEAELTDRRQLGRDVRKVLRHRQSLAGLARSLDQPQLAAIVADLAYRAGSTPDRTPAFHAVQLYLDRSFGRWTAGSGSTLIDQLEQRLRLRGVQVRTGVRVTGIGVDPLEVRFDGDRLGADAVVAACDARQLYQDLLPPSAARHERRRLRRLPGAIRPEVTLSWAEPGSDGGAAAPTETIHHRDGAGPRIEWTRPAGGRVLRISHDYGPGRTDPAGVGWRGFGSWLDRPPVSSEQPGLFVAGPHSRGGAEPSQQVLSGALAAYGCQRLVAPDRPLEPR
jgi:phytoene dehydrogenase-like protein